MTDEAKHILIVDDDRDLRDAIGVMLRARGLDVTAAANSDEALLRLRERRPRLILLDVMMRTDTEGFDFACWLKGQAEFNDIPIIFMTGMLGRVREEGPDAFLNIAGQEWPAVWCFEKPLDLPRLFAKIDAEFSGAGPGATTGSVQP